MAQKVKKKSFVMYGDMYLPTENLSLSQKGELWDAVFKYNAGEEVNISDPMAQMAFSFFRQAFDRDAEKYEAVREKRRIAGSLGGTAKATNAKQAAANVANATSAKQSIANVADNVNESVNDSDININTLSECLSGQSPDDPSLPEESESEEAGKRPHCPARVIVSLYHDILPEHPRVEILNEARKRVINARWADIGKRLRETGREDTRDARLAYMRQIFLKASQSDFLCGRTTCRDGKTYMVTFDKLMSPSGFIGVIEGKYDNRY